MRSEKRGRGQSFSWVRIGPEIKTFFYVLFSDCVSLLLPTLFLSFFHLSMFCLHVFSHLLDKLRHGTAILSSCPSLLHQHRYIYWFKSTFNCISSHLKLISSSHLLYFFFLFFSLVQASFYHVHFISSSSSSHSLSLHLILTSIPEEYLVFQK
jgi:hypothetical protein